MMHGRSVQNPTGMLNIAIKYQDEIYACIMIPTLCKLLEDITKKFEFEDLGSYFDCIKKSTTNKRTYINRVGKLQNCNPGTK